MSCQLAAARVVRAASIAFEAERVERSIALHVTVIAQDGEPRLCVLLGHRRLADLLIEVEPRRAHVADGGVTQRTRVTAMRGVRLEALAMDRVTASQHLRNVSRGAVVRCSPCGERARRRSMVSCVRTLSCMRAVYVSLRLVDVRAPVELQGSRKGTRNRWGNLAALNSAHRRGCFGARPNSTRRTSRNGRSCRGHPRGRFRTSRSEIAAW